MELVSVHIRIYPSSRIFDMLAYYADLIQFGAYTYLKDKRKTSADYDQTYIKYLFLIQMQVSTSNLDQHLEIISHYDRMFPS